MKQPKIVLLDLETCPVPEEVFKRLPSIGMWNGRTFKAELHTILSFGYKIEGVHDKAVCVNAWEFGDSMDDAALVSFIYETLKDADQIVGHNSKQFDLKVINTRLLHYGMPPLAKDIKHVDTKISAKKLSLYSNSLANVAKFFGVQDKMTFTNKWDMWVRFAFGKETDKDRKVMDEYCKADVDVLHAIYEKLMPFHGNNMVNRNQFSDGRGVCPSCGSTRLQKHGTKRTKTKEYQRLLCQDCGSVSQQSKKGKIS